jgi:hypothetical protein
MFIRNLFPHTSRAIDRKLVNIIRVREDFDVSSLAGVCAGVSGDEVQILREQPGFVPLPDLQLELPGSGPGVAVWVPVDELILSFFIMCPPHCHPLQFPEREMGATVATRKKKRKKRGWYRNVEFEAFIHPDLLYVTALGRKICSYHPVCRMFQSITYVLLGISIFQECDITGGDIKEVNRYYVMLIDLWYFMTGNSLNLEEKKQT